MEYKLEGNRIKDAWTASFGQRTESEWRMTEGRQVS